MKSGGAESIHFEIWGGGVAPPAPLVPPPMSVVPDITVEVSDNITLSEGGFDLCNNAYNFTVVANTLTGPGQRSAVVTSPDREYLLSNSSTIHAW